MVIDVHLDSGSWFACQLTKVGKASSGHIAIGGLITIISYISTFHWRMTSQYQGCLVLIWIC